MDGKPQSQWLKDVDKDQNLEELHDILKTLQNIPGKRFFVSKVLQPEIDILQYNSISGGFEFSKGQVQYAIDTGNAATSVLTCAAGEEYRVQSAQRNNGTRVATYKLDAVISGTAYAIIPDDTVAMGAIAEPRHFILSGGTYFDSAGNGRICIDEVVLREADTLTITDTSWVGGDGQTTIWRYSRRKV